MTLIPILSTRFVEAEQKYQQAWPIYLIQHKKKHRHADIKKKLSVNTDLVDKERDREKKKRN